MRDFFLQLKEKFAKPVEEEEEPIHHGEDYVELGSSTSTKEERSKVIVRPFVMEELISSR